MPLFRLRRLVLAAVLTLAACATMDPPPQGKQTPGKQAPPVARGSTEPIRFAELALGSMRRGMAIGRYVWDIDCAPPYEDVYWTTGRNLRQGSTMEERFAEVLTDAGFDVTGRLNGVHDPEVDRHRARFTVQGDLRDIRLELCRRKHWITGAGKGDSGTGAVRVDWSVYDAHSGQLVHRVTTNGVARKEAGVPQGDIMLIEEAFATAAEALAADPGFRAVVAKGSVSSGGGRESSPPLASTIPVVSSAQPSSGPASEPPASEPPASDPIVSSPVPVDTPAPPAALLIRGPAAFQGYADDPTARATSARLRVGEEGHGVALGEIDGQSVVLTPSAGLDARITVRPAQGVALDGTVVARDALGGFALVRVPARLTAVPVRGGEPAVSETVTAVVKGGADAASGIVAALRPDPRAGIDVIQADLTGPQPALGDPLVDESGNLLALARAPAPLGGPGAHGLADFTPVGPMLTRMGVRLTQGPVGATPARTSLGRTKPGLDASLDGNRRPPT
ncbi:serine protease [Azospirillum sp. sgz302134]